MSARFVAYSLLISCALLAACSSNREVKRDESTEVLGTPPTAAEDPFFYLARPPVDAKADATGTIGDATSKPKASDGNDVELRAENLALKNELAVARKRVEELEKGAALSSGSASDLAQCHSCVRLCPLRGNCADDAELVCGWGTGKKQQDAKLRATAECNGALEAMRGGAFSRIEGACPIASCSN